MKKTSQNLGYLRFPQLKQACIRLLTSTDSCRFIARSLKVSPSTIIRLKNKLAGQKISNSDEISRLSPKELYEKVYPRKQQDVRNDSQNKYLPDFEKLTSVMIEKKLNITQLYALYESEALSKELQPLSLSYFSARIKIVLKITKVIRQYHAKLIRLLYQKIRIILKGKIEPNLEFS